MEVVKRGDGAPEYSVVTVIHGDEPCGKKAVEKLLSGDIEFLKPVQFIVANEEALEKNRRFIDTDLNRSFPGDRDSEKHEERLAAEILGTVEGTKVLDLHSTMSHPEPFGAVSELGEKTRELLAATGVENAVHFPEEAGALNEHATGVVVEAGYQGSEGAVENAYRVIRNFLAAEGVIGAAHERSEPRLFQYYDTVEGRGWEFTAENFRLVEKGEVYARRNGEELVADEDFYPVLMSTEGYEDILGYRAKRYRNDF